MNKLQWQKFLAVFFCLNASLVYFTSPAQGGIILKRINRTGVLKVGVRADVIPFGYRNLDGKLEGICFDLIELIREEVTKNIERDLLSTKLYISSLFNRFELVNDQTVHLECGPNTIREIDRYRVTFSEPFFISGVRFIAKEEIANQFRNSQGAGLRIGLLRYTSTIDLIEQKYPQAKLEYFQGSNGSLRALQALRRGQIDGFASDTVLLVGEALKQRFPLGETTEYVLTPQTSLNCEPYGLVLPQIDPDWINLVNSVIESEKTQKLLEDWFEDFSPEALGDLKNCQLPQ